MFLIERRVNKDFAQSIFDAEGRSTSGGGRRNTLVARGGEGGPPITSFFSIFILLKEAHLENQHSHRTKREKEFVISGGSTICKLLATQVKLKIA